jgi:hypothetical protein
MKSITIDNNVITGNDSKEKVEKIYNPAPS